MFRKIMPWALLASLLSPPVFAAAEETGSLSIEERLKALEDHQIEIYHTLAEKKAAGLGTRLTERLTFSGLVEVEATGENTTYVGGSKEAGSDLVLATAQLGLGMKLTEALRGNIGLLYEEDAELEVDEAAIDINQAPVFVRLGRFYLPFGVFRSHFVSDPLTLVLGETRETAALIGFGYEFVSVSAFLFNGEAEKVGEEDHISDWGASLVVTPAEGIELGGSFLSDLADTDAGLSGEYRRRVGGWSAFASIGSETLGFSGEFLGAIRSFSASDLDEDGNGHGDHPQAWNLEAFYSFVENVEMALRYEGSKEFAGNPKRQYGVDISWSPWPYTTLSVEYLRGEFDSGFAMDENGDILKQRDLLTAQMAIEF